MMFVQDYQDKYPQQGEGLKLAFYRTLPVLDAFRHKSWAGNWQRRDALVNAFILFLSRNDFVLYNCSEIICS